MDLKNEGKAIEAGLKKMMTSRKALPSASK
jgi:hypothetical protein